MDAPKELKRTNARIPARMIALIVAAVLVVAVVIGLCISISSCGNMQDRYAAARNQTGEAIYQNLYMLLRKNEETSLAGADVEGSILPSMREYFLAARTLNETLTDAYGANYTVLSADQISAVESAFAAYDAAFKGGKSTDEAQSTLNAALLPIETLLLERYTEDGALLPVK